MDGTAECTSTATYDKVQPAAGIQPRQGRTNIVHLANVRLGSVIIALALTLSVADWLSAIRAPLSLDETGSYWSIAGGFWQIWSRQGLSFPAYSYILWLVNSLFGSNEVVLRMPSVLAMLAAAYVLFRIARRFFEADVAGIVTFIFCIHPVVAFAAVDARPYAFAVLITNCAILALLRWIETSSKRDAILFGAATAGIVYFHYLFSLIVAAFALIILITRRREWKSLASKLAIAFVPFTLMMLPVLSRLAFLVQTRKAHVYAAKPQLHDLLQVFGPGQLAGIFVGAAFLAITIRKFADPENEPAEPIHTCLLLGAVPLFILYGVSSLTNIRIFHPRYTLVALPGVALCWGFLISRMGSRFVRIIFCLGLIVATFHELPCSSWKQHGYSWRDALEAANANAASDHAPMLIASGFIESDFEPLPTDVMKSPMFAPISYYKVHSEVVALPRDLTPAARAQVNNFLAAATPARQRFLVVIHEGGTRRMGTWIHSVTEEHYQAREVARYDEVAVTEYIPR